MNYRNDISIWDCALVKILKLKHGLLIHQETTSVFESSSFLFAMGRAGKLFFGDHSYPFTSNCLVHLGPDRQITISSETDEVEYYFVVYQADLAPSAGRRLLSETLRNDPFQRSYAVHVSDPVCFADQFSSMANEWHSQTPLALLNLKKCFYSILSSLYKELAVSQENTGKKDKRIEPDAVEYVYRYLGQNYSQAISIQTLSNTLGISRSTLHEQFKSRFHMSPQQYLMKLRLDSACRLLENSSLSVDEIAVSCGLRDKSYFSRVFKDKYGISPGAFRASYSGNDLERKDTDGFWLTEREHQCADNAKKEEYTTIENMGRVHRYLEVPERIVCLDYSAAEICAALGVADRITGVASAEGALSDCMKEYRKDIAKAPFLQGLSPEWNVPDFRSVCDCRPDIVIGTGYSFNRYGGIADAEEFEVENMHIYAMEATYLLGCTYESVYEDIHNLGKIFEKEERAEELVQGMMADERILDRISGQYQVPVRVFSFDSAVSGKALTCGRALEDHIIRSAGGINVFGDRERQFAAVEWSEVGEADPQVILVHCFHTRKDGIEKAAYLRQVPEIAGTEAVRNNRIFLIGIKEVFPGLGNVKTALKLAGLFHPDA